MKAALLALLLAAGAARAEVSVSLGGGLAYELLGFDFAYRSGHAEGYVGLGALSLMPGVAFGGRYFLRSDGNGFFLALNLAAHGDSIHFDTEGATKGRLFWATVTPGYRASWGTFFLQLAIGAGVIYQLTFWDTPPNPTHDFGPILDAMVAAGFTF